MSGAGFYLRALADAHGFTHVVYTRLSSADTNPALRPARGDGPLVLALFVNTVWHGWTKDNPVHYGHVSVTHAPTGLCVHDFAHPFTPTAPVRPWLIPATAQAIVFAEDLRQRYLALDVPWDNFPEDTASRLEIERKIRAVEPSAETIAKVERDALKQFRAELKARLVGGRWGYLNKSQTAELMRELVRSRFPWTARKRKKAA